MKRCLIPCLTAMLLALTGILCACGQNSTGGDTTSPVPGGDTPAELYATVTEYLKQGYEQTRELHKTLSMDMGDGSSMTIEQIDTYTNRVSGNDLYQTCQREDGLGGVSESELWYVDGYLYAEGYNDDSEAVKAKVAATVGEAAEYCGFDPTGDALMVMPPSWLEAATLERSDGCYVLTVTVSGEQLAGADDGAVQDDIIAMGMTLDKLTYALTASADGSHVSVEYTKHYSVEGGIYTVEGTETFTAIGTTAVTVPEDADTYVDSVLPTA